jgi:hypothetical protein
MKDYMKTPHIFVLACAGALLSGCESTHQAGTSMMATESYAAREPIATSLFPSDQAVMGDDAVARILSSKMELRLRPRSL